MQISSNLSGDSTSSLIFGNFSLESKISSPKARNMSSFQRSLPVSKLRPRHFENTIAPQSEHRPLLDRNLFKYIKKNFIRPFDVWEASIVWTFEVLWWCIPSDAPKNLSTLAPITDGLPAQGTYSLILFVLLIE